MKRLLLALAVLALACSCSNKVNDYTDWLYEYMPLPDSLHHTRSWWEANVAKTLAVREQMQWNIPEREFRHFVLPLRVNNESLDDFRTVYADTLCRRVQGLGLAEAALEINHWCHEQASYEPADARTSAPMATVRRGVGRCGEESVLTVAALRAAGIPARQVYTPRWAHTDDNHAWVEVWVDGKWHFLGACEPAPTLDNAWFNGPVSQAMLLHTKVYGDYDGPEGVIQRTPCFTEINVTSGYVPTKDIVVTVFEDDSPVEGAEVGFTIYNYAEFYTVARYITGSNGSASLKTGLGDMYVWARKGDRFGYGQAKVGHYSVDSVSVVLDHKAGERFSADFIIEPPHENPIPTGATQEQEEANKLRLAEEDAIRNSHPHNNPDADDFLAAHGAEGQRLLNLISAKDRGDVSREVLEDALEGAHGCTDPYVLNPRVEIEPLLPFRREVLASGIAEQLGSADEVTQWVRSNIRLREGRNPQGLRTAPIAVWRSRLADAKARDIFCVALCRTLGFPARIDPVTGKLQYRTGGLWADVRLSGDAAPEATPQGTLRIVRDLPAEYYRDFTISALTDGGPQLMEYDEGSTLQKAYSLDEGYYVLTSGTRFGGYIFVRQEFFPLPAGEDTYVPLILQNRDISRPVIGNIDISSLPDDAAHRGAMIIAVLGSRTEEPTNHAIRELESLAADLNKNYSTPLIVTGNARIEGIDLIFRLPEAPESLLKSLSDIGKPGLTLPVVAVCDGEGKVYYISKGYNPSLASNIYYARHTIFNIILVD